MSTLSELQFVKLKFPRLIPENLIELAKGRTFTAEQFYAYQEENKENPSNFLFAVVDKDKKIHGYLWAQINRLDGSLFINTFSISKEYWGKGEALKMALSHIKALNEVYHFTKIYWGTKNNKFFLKHGFTQCNFFWMEYDLNKKDDEDGTE